MADKAEAIGQLEAHGLPMPASLSISLGTIDKLEEFLRAWPGTEYWYLRFDERLAPGLPRVGATADLPQLIRDAVTFAPALRVIVQERVVAVRSGVMATLPSTVFIEYIAGELRPLLRMGVTPSRVLLRRGGDLVDTEENRQELASWWDGLDFRHAPYPGGPFGLPASVIEHLLSASENIGEVAILEWLERPSGAVTFLDFRAMPASFLSNGLSLFVDGAQHWSRLPSKTEAAARQALWPQGALDRPLFEYVETLLPGAEAMHFRAGGLLSHLCVYAAERDILCSVKRSEPADD